MHQCGGIGGDLRKMTHWVKGRVAEDEKPLEKHMKVPLLCSHDDIF